MELDCEVEEKDILARKINKEELIVYLKEKQFLIEEERLLGVYMQMTSIQMLFESEKLVLVKTLNDEGIYLGCFNRKDQEIKVAIPLSCLSLLGHHIVYDVLRKEELGMIESTLMLSIPAQGIRHVRFIDMM